ncbi:MAG: flagellar hook-basal body complex protein [Burkholderiales bacterium]|nr:flagellar hook-basal body complex protein [Burkholderiales bacterium]
MSFYTSLTGLNAATSQLSVTSNNIANVGTTGFKRSRADFGDIFATSPLQKASSVIGQGVALKQVSQEFSQGNIQFSANSLDIAITGDGFFPLKSADGLQDIFTRNGTFMLNDSYNVVNSAGQALIAAAVDSSGKADLDNLSKLLIPRKTSGDAVATSEIQLGLNFPSDAQVPTLPFDRNDPTTYNKTTAVTVYDAGGNGYLATVYYRKTQVASPDDPSNKWQTYVFIGDTKLQELLIQSTDKSGDKQYVNKYGEIRAEADIPPQDIARGVTKLFNLDDLKNPLASSAASVSGTALPPLLTNEWKNAISFPAKINQLLEDGTAGEISYPTTAGAGSYTFDDGIAPVYKEDNLQDLVAAINGDLEFPHDYVVSLNATGDALVVVVKDGGTLAPPPIVTAIPAEEIIFSNLTQAPSADTTDGTDAINEKATVTFTALQAGDTVTIDTRTLTATVAMTANEVAAAFKAVTNPTKGSFNGTTLTDWEVDPTFVGVGAEVKFVSKDTGDVTNLVPAAAATMATPNVTTVSTAGTLETATITFKDLVATESVTIGGLTFTATGAVTAADLAIAFEGLANGTDSTTANGSQILPAGSFTAGTLTGWAGGTPVGDDLEFTASVVGNATNITATSAAVAGAPTVVTVAGTPDVNEVNTVTFKAMEDGDTVTVGGLTFTATGPVTATQVASAFAGLAAGSTAAQATAAALLTNPTLAGSFSAGPLANWATTTATATGATLAFTAATNGNITNIVVSRTLPAIGVSIADNEAGVAETTVLTFKDMKAGDVVTVAGLKFTATEALTGTEVAALFAELSDGDTAAEAAAANPTTAGTFSGGPFVKWSSGTAEGAEITLTSTDAANVANINTQVSFLRPNVDSIIEYAKVEGAKSYSFNDGTTTFTASTLKLLAVEITKANATHPSYTASFDTVTGNLSVNKVDDTAPDITVIAAFSAAAGITFDLNVDGSSQDIKIDLSYLQNLTAEKKYTGVELAREITNVINKSYGDERYFDFSSLSSTANPDTASLFKISTDNGTEHVISITQNPDPTIGDVTDLKAVTIADSVAILQKKIHDVFNQPGDPEITVGYNPVKRSFTFKASNDAVISLQAPGQIKNELFDLPTAKVAVDPLTGTYGATVTPNGSTILDPLDHRYGINVTFEETSGTFNISSSSTGDTSSIKISNASSLASALFGFPQGVDGVSTDTSSTPLRGITSEPAILNGNTIGINLDNKFRVDGSNNQFVVTVDNVTSLIEMPQRSDYNIEEFRQDLERRINSLADGFGRTVNGVKVGISTTPGTNNKFFTFTTGTTGDNSFLKVSANSIWGLANIESARGSTSRWLEPKQAMNGDGFPLYVDRDGLETSDPGAFSEDETRELWSPIFLDKGELTFDTGGNLKSPEAATQFKSTTIGNSGATLQFSIDYGSSTQFSSPFSVLKQNQNGRPEGDLIGVDIADDGLVSASYSNGNQKSLAKIILVNFASPTGLRQIGDSSYYSTSKSGDAKFGEAGAAGFGTVRAGARERANVDLTTELVELITAQRNFQANAKAIETNNTLTQAIINIRS